MKGVVFTEFLEMVEDRFTANMVDDIIEDSKIPSGGAYTAVGTYPHEEMVTLVTALSKRSNTTVPNLLRVFGEHLFGRFIQLYPAFFKEPHSAFSFLAGIENIIHAEVLKLYPTAELPHIDIEHHCSEKLVMLYDSRLHFEDFAEGLLRGCITHFGEDISITRSVVGEGHARKERFVLSRTA